MHNWGEELCGFLHFLGMAVYFRLGGGGGVQVSSIGAGCYCECSMVRLVRLLVVCACDEHDGSGRERKRCMHTPEGQECGGSGPRPSFPPRLFRDCFATV